MRINIDREKKVIILKWLKKGYIDTEDIKEVNDVRDNWFENLMKELDAEHEEEGGSNNGDM